MNIKNTTDFFFAFLQKFGYDDNVLFYLYDKNKIAELSINGNEITIFDEFNFSIKLNGKNDFSITQFCDNYVKYTHTQNWIDWLTQYQIIKNDGVYKIYFDYDD